MTRLTHLQLGIAAMGIILWGYGVRAEDSLFRLLGIGALLVATLLRFARRR